MGSKADALASAVQDGALKGVTLRLLIEHLTALDTLEFDLNGKLLDTASARKRLLYNDCWLDFDVFPPVLKQGWNNLKVTVLVRASFEAASSATAARARSP